MAPNFDAGTNRNDLVLVYQNITEPNTSIIRIYNLMQISFSRVFMKELLIYVASGICLNNTLYLSAVKLFADQLIFEYLKLFLTLFWEQNRYFLVTASSKNAPKM